ncbi:alpha/beta hydrolase [Streptomyces sp. ME01-24h]|nr:alpha/beta hydrolase [Streptomyces sp. ME01-24h]
MKDALAPGAHEISVDGIRQRYHVAGQGPVCLVHPGGPGGHWEYLRMPLVEEGVTTVYVAPVGAGESDDIPGDDYAMHTYVRFVDALVDHLGVPDIHFLGHSHGAMAGLQYALEHPGKLAGLLLYAGAPVHGPDLGAEMNIQIQRFTERFAGHPGLDAVLKAREVGGLAQINDKAGLGAYMLGILPLYFRDFWEMEEQLKPWLREFDIESAPALHPHDWDVRGQLGALDLPTTIMAGRYDFICPVRWAQEMNREMSTSRVTVFERSGHFAHVEQPEEFARAVLDFFH